MRMLALLVALFLPLHGITNAFGSIQSPAHYHRMLPQQMAIPRLYVPQLASQVLAVLDSDTAATRQDGLSAASHGHALDQAGVVYTEGDPDPADHGAAGKHAQTAGDAILPIWMMPLLAVQEGARPPEPALAFCSHQATPLLRPPCASGCLIA